MVIVDSIVCSEGSFNLEKDGGEREEYYYSCFEKEREVTSISPARASADLRMISPTRLVNGEHTGQEFLCGFVDDLVGSKNYPGAGWVHSFGSISSHKLSVPARAPVVIASMSVEAWRSRSSIKSNLCDLHPSDLCDKALPTLD